MRKIKMAFMVIAILVIFALETFRLINIYWTSMWSLLLIVLGIVLHVIYFSHGAQKRLAFLLLPGGMCLSLGNLWLSNHSHYFVWALYLLGMGFGLFEWQVFGEEEDFGFPIILCAGMSLLLMIADGFSFRYLWPVIFIGSCGYFSYNKRQYVCNE